MPIWARPPGKYNRTTSNPILDVSNATKLLLGKKAGSPMTHTAPITAPLIEPKPPMTTIATRVSESLTKKNSWL